MPTRKTEVADRRAEADWLYSRYRPEVSATLAAGRVAVAGLGGLGSHVALALARSGVGHLKLVDFDVVEPSNLGRQAYGPEHLGRLKTEALAEILRSINPGLDLCPLELKLDGHNIPEALNGYPIIVEALDRPESKAELVSTALAVFPEAKVVCASGLAGFEEANLIQTRRLSERLYLCGDGQSGLENSGFLAAPRVMIAAGHQANLVLRLLLGLENKQLDEDIK